MGVKVPKEGSLWHSVTDKRKDKIIYTVLFTTNLLIPTSLPQVRKANPEQVVFVSPGGKIWSKPLSEWDESFTKKS